MIKFNVITLAAFMALTLTSQASSQPNKTPVATSDKAGECQLCVEDNSGHMNCEPADCSKLPSVVATGAIMRHICPINERTRTTPNSVCYVRRKP